MGGVWAERTVRDVDYRASPILKPFTSYSIHFNPFASLRTPCIRTMRELSAWVERCWLPEWFQETRDFFHATFSHVGLLLRHVTATGLEQAIG